METCNVLSSFYDNIQSDIVSFSLPDDETSCLINSCRAIIVQISCCDCEDDTRRLITDLTRLGKALESAIINASPLRRPDVADWIFPVGNRLPSLFERTFRKLFYENGENRCSPMSLFSQGLTVENICSDGDLALRFKLLRQLLLGFSKVKDIEASISEESELIAFKERITRFFDPYSSRTIVDLEFRSYIIPIARALLSAVLTEGDALVAPLAQWAEDPFGLHGPGAVAGGEKDAEKWQLTQHPRLPERLTVGCFGDLSTKKVLDPDTISFVSRVAVVPKDCTKHRIICIEPKELMFAQQGLMKVLYAVISSSLFTKNVIHLFDQSHNYYASRRTDVATIDLSDASDLLNIELCRAILPREFFKLVTRYRSSGIEFPDGTVVEPYTSMATMGNALCFPIETLVFWALTLAGVLASEIRVGTYTSVEDVTWVIRHNPSPLLRRFNVRVFGDDIIVKSPYIKSVCEVLTASGLAVNTNKTCDSNSTPIRESCGAYWWGAYDVRVAKLTHSRVHNVHQAISLIDTIDQLRDLGFTNLSRGLTTLLGGVIPYYDSSLVSIQEGVKEGVVRFNTELQRLEKWHPHLVRDGSWSTLPGDVALYAHFTGQATRPLSLGDVQIVQWGWEPLVL